MRADFEPGGGISESVESLIQGGSPHCVAIRGIDVSHDPQDGAGPEYLSAQGRIKAHQESSEVTWGWELGLSSAGGGNGRSGL